MTMVGDTFDNARRRASMPRSEFGERLADNRSSSSANGWPANLGVPSAVGGQNTVRYAIFPSTRRLAIQMNGVTKIFDTGVRSR